MCQQIPSFSGNNTKDDAGAAKVIKVGAYYYIFFLAKGDSNTPTTGEMFQTHVARSAVSSGGLPGTWFKYFNGSFSQPGLGGKSSQVDPDLLPTANFVTYNTYLNRYITLYVSGRWGFYLSYTLVGQTDTTLLSWQQAPHTLFPLVSHPNDLNVDHWLGPGDKQTYAYSSTISPNGDSDATGQEFYLYYTKVFEKDNIVYSRNLMRRKISLNKSPSSSYDAMIKLTRYEKSSPQKSKISTEVARPSEGYTKREDMGYILPYQAEGFRPVYECFIPTWNDYMLSIGNPYPSSNSNNPTTLNTWKHCESDGDQFIRTIGYVAINSTPPFTTALYRCFDSANSNHFASTNSSCEGKQNEFLLGYIAPLISVTPTLIPGDVDKDGKVNISDYNLIIQYFGNNTPGNSADLTKNGIVDIFDYTILVGNYGK